MYQAYQVCQGNTYHLNKLNKSFQISTKVIYYCSP